MRDSDAPRITPVLLCGGSGTRLWPLSRKSYPKQFVPILDERSLFQAAAGRFAADGFAPPVVVTGNPFRFVVTRQLEEIGMRAGATLIEPEGRNTAPAAAAAALWLSAREREGLMLIVPSDHAIAEPDRFHKAIEKGRAAAMFGRIVTFGVAPTRPETAFGWLEAGKEGVAGVHDLASFVEKPDAETAERLYRDGRHLWNTGIFLARADVVLAAFGAHAPEVLEAVAPAVARAKEDLDFTRLDAEAWSRVPAISIDYAVMEKATNLSVVRYDGLWTDLGSWHAVGHEMGRDSRGNATSAGAVAIDCEESILRSEADDIAVVGLGLRNVTAVATRDAVLIADTSRSQEVGAAVEALRALGMSQAERFPVDHRPWGWFETLIRGDRFQVKRIHVHPGASLSLQSHLHRAEHWIVVEGTARVTVGDEVRLVSENESIYVPLGVRHRLENPGKLPMVLIEVQTGGYLGEDDIVRYDDRYARCPDKN